MVISTENSLAFPNCFDIMEGNVEGESILIPSKESADTAESCAAEYGKAPGS